MRTQHLAGVLLLLAAIGLQQEALAQAALPAVTATPAPGGGQTFSLTIQTLLFLTSLTFLPAILLMMTSFTRIIIVLSLLRQALGTVQAPPNQVLIGLSLFLTFFVMAPVFEQIYSEAYVPFSERRHRVQRGAGARLRSAQGLHAAPDPAVRSGACSPISPNSRRWRAPTRCR